MWHILNIEYIQMIKDMQSILLNKAGANPLPWLILAFRGQKSVVERTLVALA